MPISALLAGSPSGTSPRTGDLCPLHCGRAEPAAPAGKMAASSEPAPPLSNQSAATKLAAGRYLCPPEGGVVQ